MDTVWDVLTGNLVRRLSRGHVRACNGVAVKPAARVNLTCLRRPLSCSLPCGCSRRSCATSRGTLSFRVSFQPRYVISLIGTSGVAVANETLARVLVAVTCAVGYHRWHLGLQARSDRVGSLGQRRFVQVYRVCTASLIDFNLGRHLACRRGSMKTVQQERDDQQHGEDEPR